MKNFHVQKQKAHRSAYNHAADQHLCFHYIHVRGMIQNNVDFCYNFNTVHLTLIKIIGP